MADKITRTVTLGVGIDYINQTTQKNVTKYLKIPNPRDGISKTQIQTALQNYLTGDIFLDEDTGEPLVGTTVKTAYTETTKTTDYDLGFFDN